MKKKLLYILLLVIVTSCAEKGIEINNLSKEYLKNKNDVEKINNEFIQNFENSSVNFIINQEPVYSSRSSESNAYDYKLNVKSQYTNGQEIQTSLKYKFNEDGSFNVTHCDGEYIFAVLSYDKAQKLKNIQLGENTRSISTRAQKSWYKCVNDHYKEYMRKVGDDWVNDLTCTAFAVPCRALAALASIEHCSH